MTVEPAVVDARVEEPGSRPWARRLERWRVPLVALLGFVMLGTAWLLSSPLYAGPDEPDHVARAAAVARGEWQGFIAPDEYGRPAGAVHAPYGVVSPRRGALCFAHHSDLPASCQRLHATSGRLVVASTGAARYYPPYYAIDGLPSLASPGPTGVYLMRALSMLVCALLLASAVASMTLFGNRLAVLGVLVAATPMVFFVTSVVNPSSVEIAGGVACWAAGVALARDAGGHAARPRLVRRFALGALAMLLVRPTAPLWLALSVALLAYGAGWPRLRELARRRHVQVWSLVLIAATIGNALWTRGPGALDKTSYPPHVTFAAALHEAMRKWLWRNDQLIGAFGWLDVKPPQATYWIWIVMLVALAVVCVARASWRWRFVFVVTAAAAAVVPVLLEAAQANSYGFGWQGRYTLPFAVGVPIVAAAVGGRLVAGRWQRPVVVGAAVVLAVGQLLALAANALRYQHGVGGSLDVLSGAWLPPGGPWPVALLGVGGCAALVVASGLLRDPSVPLIE